MSEWFAKTRWTSWLFDGDPVFNRRDALYLYALPDVSVYIGEAGEQTVEQRISAHIRRDKVGRWIRRNIQDWRTLGIKVGIPEFPPGDKFSLEKLHDIQTLLIIQERKRGGALANDANTVTRNTHRKGTIVLNVGDYSPLAKRYVDTGPMILV